MIIFGLVKIKKRRMILTNTVLNRILHFAIVCLNIAHGAITDSNIQNSQSRSLRTCFRRTNSPFILFLYEFLITPFYINVHELIVSINRWYTFLQSGFGFGLIIAETQPGMWQIRIATLSAAASLFLQSFWFWVKFILLGVFGQRFGIIASFTASQALRRWIAFLLGRIGSPWGQLSMTRSSQTVPKRHLLLFFRLFIQLTLLTQTFVIQHTIQLRALNPQLLLRLDNVMWHSIEANWIIPWLHGLRCNTSCLLLI